MLIICDKHTREDLSLWNELEASDLIWYEENQKKMQERENKAIEEIIKFAQAGKFYVGVSWGKDSVIVAHLAHRARLYRDPRKDGGFHRRLKFHSIPLIWIKPEPIFNKYCCNVRDLYVQKYYPDYSEIVVNCRIDSLGVHASGTLEAGAQEAAKRYSDRYISGINRNESGARELSRRRHGISTEKCCRPIIDWPPKAIYAYLVKYDLPIHPNYAMSGGGRWDRQYIRVASLGGKRGDGMGRAQWESEYYQDELNALEAMRHKSKQA